VLAKEQGIVYVQRCREEAISRARQTSRVKYNVPTVKYWMGSMADLVVTVILKINRQMLILLFELHSSFGYVITSLTCRPQFWSPYSSRSRSSAVGVVTGFGVGKRQGQGQETGTRDKGKYKRQGQDTGTGTRDGASKRDRDRDKRQGQETRASTRDRNKIQGQGQETGAETRDRDRDKRQGQGQERGTRYSDRDKRQGQGQGQAGPRDFCFLQGI
jgi:hypothetical protein